jgi:hypothetical protein
MNIPGISRRLADYREHLFSMDKMAGCICEEYCQNVWNPGKSSKKKEGHNES